MTPFRQLIRPGNIGNDVKAVKRALKVMHAPHSDSLILDKFAGEGFVKSIKAVQRNHGQKPDGIYGKRTHAIIAPHFDLWGRALYRSARIRKLPHPPLPAIGASVNAKKLLEFGRQGKYHADNFGDLGDIERTAKGLPVWSQGGYWVHIDSRVMEVLVWLIEQGHRIGTFAICSDHHNDGPHGHAGGRAVDISSIDGISINSHGARAVTLNVAKALHNAPAHLHPWQLICGGYASMRDWEISGLSIPAADSFYGSATMREHTNHIHNGYL